MKLPDDAALAGPRRTLPAIVLSARVFRSHGHNQRSLGMYA